MVEALDRQPALADLDRLFDFLAENDHASAGHAAQRIADAIALQSEAAGLTRGRMAGVSATLAP